MQQKRKGKRKSRREILDQLLMVLKMEKEGHKPASQGMQDACRSRALSVANNQQETRNSVQYLHATEFC